MCLIMQQNMILKKVRSVGTSDFPKQADLASLNFDVDKFKY